MLRADRPDVSPMTNPYSTVVLQMDRSHVDTVLTAGTIHERNGRPTRDDTALLEQARNTTRRLATAGVLEAITV